MASSLMSVSVGRLLTPPSDASSILVKGGEGDDRLEPLRPAEVAARLNRLFPFELSTEQYFTLVYGVLDASTGEFRYTLAGHPGPILLSADGKAKILPGRGYPIGLADGPSPYNEWSVRLTPGDRLYLYSDGIPEAVSPEGDAVRERPAAPEDRGRSVRAALLGRQRAGGGGRVVVRASADVRDDVSVLAVEFTGESLRP